jgi:hypothetical protein
MFNKISDASKVTNIPDGAVLVEGFLSKCEDVTSTNGYRYEKDFWSTVTSRDDFKERVDSREMLGCIEHPIDDEDYMFTDYNKAALIVLDVSMRGTDPYGVIGLLNNDNGNKLKSIVEFGSRVGVSTRGIGSTKQTNSYTVVDSAGYSVITWDSVRNPNLPVKLGLISDSMLKSPKFKEMFDAVKLRDSGAVHFNRNNVESDIKKLHDEAQAYAASVSKIRKSIIGDGATLIKAKAAYDKYIADGGSVESLIKSRSKHTLAYAYLCSL